MGPQDDAIDVVKWLFLEAKHKTSHKVDFERKKKLAKGQRKIYRREYVFRESHVINLIKLLNNFIYQKVFPM